jgi:hypothetical protein
VFGTLIPHGGSVARQDADNDAKLIGFGANYIRF